MAPNGWLLMKRPVVIKWVGYLFIRMKVNGLTVWTWYPCYDGVDIGDKENPSLVFSGDREIPTRRSTVPVGNEASVDPRVGISRFHCTPMIDSISHISNKNIFILYIWRDTVVYLWRRTVKYVSFQGHN